MNKILLIASLFIHLSFKSILSNQSLKTETQPNSIEEPVVLETINFETYCNPRFGYCIDFPKNILYPQPESSNGDGRVFKNKKGQNVLTVFGRMIESSNDRAVLLEQQFEDDLHDNDRVITYQKIGKTFFVISGYEKGKIFYQKTILKDDSFAFAILEYEEVEKNIFNKISQRVFKSFK